MIKLFRDKQRVVLSAGWQPGLPDDCKSVAGATFRAASKTWSYPLTMATLRGLRRVFGDALEPGAELLAWAAVERDRERKLRHLAQRSDTELVRVPAVAPGLAAAMANRTYQRVGAAFGAAAEMFLLADEPGLGKTAVAIATLIEGDSWRNDHLVIAPKASLTSVWRRQLHMWTPDAQVVAVREGADKRRQDLELFWELDEPRFLVINPAMIARLYQHKCTVCEIWQEDVEKKKAKWPPEHHLDEHKVRKVKRMIRTESWPEIIDHPWESVILDESHQILAAYNPSNVTQQTAGLLDLRARRKIALTGTPLRGYETRIWGTLDWLGHKTGGYWPWVNQYFEVGSNGFAAQVHGLDPAMRKEFYATLDRFVLRRTRAEARPDLPMGQRMDVLLEMTPKHAAQYEEFERMGETALESGIIAGLGALSEITRLKQFAFGIWANVNGKLQPTGESSMVDAALQFLRERGVTGKKSQDFMPEPGSAYKYVFVSQFTEVLDAFERVLQDKGVASMKITGEVSGPRRNDAVAKFQSKDETVRVCLIQTTTGGVSIELDAWCDELVFFDETHIADDQVQVEGRINNRSGRVAPRTWWYFRMADTIQQKIADANLSQHRLQHEMLDGRRGVQTALHLIRKEYDSV